MLDIIECRVCKKHPSQIKVTTSRRGEVIPAKVFSKNLTESIKGKCMISNARVLYLASQSVGLSLVYVKSDFHKSSDYSKSGM